MTSGFTRIIALGAETAGKAMPGGRIKEQYLGAFLGLGLAAVFVSVRAHSRAMAEEIPWYDWLCAGGGLAVGGYVLVRYPAIAYQLGVVT